MALVVEGELAGVAVVELLRFLPLLLLSGDVMTIRWG